MFSFVVLPLVLALQSIPWRVNENNALLWDDKPYLPVGVRIAANPDQIKTVAELGVKDVILDVNGDGSGWEEAVKCAEENGLRYILSPIGMTPSSPYYAVEPQSYRIAKITESREVDVMIPGAQSALCILVTQRDSEIEKVERAIVVNGRLRLQIEPKNDLDHVLLIYPEVDDKQAVDYYEAFDRRRDNLIASIRNARPGPGFRGVLNPIGVRSEYPAGDSQQIPTSPLFRAELEDFLRRKYTTTETCLKSWAMNAPTISTFAEIARLVPLWSANRGISQMLDPVTDQLHPCENKKSRAWDDIHQVKRLASARRYDRLVTSLQSIARVPVVQEWEGWNGPYAASRIHLGGIGMRVGDLSTPVSLEEAGSAASTALAFSSPIWFLATDIEASNAKTMESLERAVRLAADLGARGWFMRFDGDAESARRVAAIAAQYSSDAAFTQWKPTALLFPYSAMNPARIMDIGGGKWWLPAPGSGTRLDLGNEFAGYRYSTEGRSFSAIWSLKGERRMLLHLLDGKFARVEGLNGFDPKPKVVKKGIEVTIGQTPILISGVTDAPIPDFAYKETLAYLERILTAIEKAGIESSEEKLEFRDSFNAFDRAPYPAYLALRRQLRRLNIVLGATIWLEGEVSREHSFSEPISTPGASGNSVLSLRPRLADPRNPYRANFTFGVRVNGAHEVYLGGKFPRGSWKDVTVRIGDQALSIQDGPINLYGSGYGWYRCGKLELGTGAVKMALEVSPTCVLDIDLDAIVLSPGTFVPDGVKTPEVKFDNRADN